MKAYKFLGVLFLFLFVSCSKNISMNQSRDTLARIQQKGEIDACTVVNPPYVIKDASSGELTGVCVDLFDLIAGRINAKVVWHETTYGNAAADLASQRCDVVAANFNANISRAFSVAFTQPPIWYNGMNAMVRTTDARFHHVTNVFQFDKPEITVVVATGEAGDLFVKEHFKEAKIKRIDVESADITRFGVEVTASRADVAISGAATMAPYLAEHSEVKGLFDQKPFSLNPASWAVRQDDIRWLHFLETALQFMETQGTLAQLEKRYNVHAIHQVKQYKVQ